MRPVFRARLFGVLALAMALATGAARATGRPAPAARNGVGAGAAAAAASRADFLLFRIVPGDWTSGARAAVTWGSSFATDLTVSADTGATWITLLSDVPADAFIERTFPVPAIATDSLLVRLSPSGVPPTPQNSLIYDRRVVVHRFAIQFPPPAPRPRAFAGDSLELQWTGGTPATAEMTLDGGQSWFVLGDGVGGADSNRVRLPLPVARADSARVRIHPTWGLGRAVDQAQTPTTAAIDYFDFDTTRALVTDRLALGPLTARWRGAAPADLELSFDGGAHWTILAGGLGGRARDTVTVTLPDSSGATAVLRLRVSGRPAADTTVAAMSGSFPVRHHRLLVPNGGESWHADSVHAVRWLGRAPADVAISLDDGVHWTPLAGAQGGEDSNQVELRMPSLASPLARMRVSRADRPAVGLAADTSDSAFTLAGDGAALSPVLLGVAVLDGESPGQLAGTALAPAGDFDGDGRPDLVVTTTNNYLSGLTRGRAYVLPGSGGPRRVLDNLPSEGFGQSVAGGGDFNGDGSPDIVVGAPHSVYGNFGPVGRAAVYFGWPDADSLEDLTLSYAARPSNELTANFGSSVAGIGDFNGDGFDDIAVGTSSPTLTAQRVNIYFGGIRPDGRPDIELTSTLASFGTALARVGDVNGDGYDDLLVGAPAPVACAVLYFGGPGTRPSSLFIPSPTTPPTYFGTALTGLGDQDGDGYDDFAIGAPLEPGGAAGPGRVYLYRGGAVVSPQPFTFLSGPVSAGLFGSAVADAGDVDGDGVDDLIVGAYHTSTTQSLVGRAYLYSGGAQPVATPLLVLEGRGANDNLGVGVASAGDRDGDGFSEFAVGIPGRDSVAFNTGEARVYTIERPHLLAPTPPETWLVGEQRAIRWSGTPLVDVSLSLDGGASWEPLATGVGGAPQNAITLTVPDAPTLDARVRLSRSGLFPQSWSQTSTRAPIRVARPVPPAAAVADERDPLRGAAPGERFGTRLGAIGGWDHDGVPELLVVAEPAATPPRLLRVAIDGRVRHALLAPGAGPRLGAALATGADVDGDHFDDLVVGDPRDDGAPGAVRIWRGGTPPDSTPTTVLAWPAAGGSFGAAVACGDLDGDGRAEIAVGAPDDTIFASRGRVYVFRGLVPSAPYAVLTGSQSGSRFGAAVAIGDLDGDGRADLVVGAPGAAVGGAGSGEVQVFRGGASIATRPTLRIDGDQPGAAFGSTVAFPGDLDGDGRADLAVGAPLYDAAGAVDAGRVAVYLGAATFDPHADVSILGTEPGAWCGTSLAGGDLDGDGFDDLLVGSPLEGPTGEGAVRLYRGGLAPDARVIAAWIGTAPAAHLGAALATAPDSDGLADALLGAPHASTGGPEDGMVRVVDWARYRVLSPRAGARWPAGSLQRVSWRGAEPADVALSTDEGASWTEVAHAVGGADTSEATIRVPSAAGVARVRVAPSRAGLAGAVRSESFAIDRAVTLVSFTARPTPDGVALAWATDPPFGPAGIAGYRVYRRPPGASGDGERVGPDPIAATTYLDATGVPGSTYALRALSGLGEETAVGQVAIEVAIGGLVVWPVPAHGGEPVRLAFVAPTDAAGRAPADLDVTIYDITGRRVATLGAGPLATVVGRVSLAWDGRMHGGHAAAGIYFVRAEAPSARFRAERRVVLAR